MPTERTRPGPGERGASPGVPLADPDAIATTLLAAGKMRAAAEEVIRAHGQRIRLYLLSLLREPDVADDAYSLWCEWIFSALDRYEGASSLRTWAYGVAHNAARRIRDDAFRRRRCSLSRAGTSRAAARNSSSARRHERSARLLDAIREKLSLDEQGLLTLRVDHGLEWEAVSAILSAGESQVTATALRKRFERLKDRIRQLAADAGALE